MKKYIIKNIFTYKAALLASVLLLQSCVGTIDESPSTTITTPAQSEKLSFSGVKLCSAISNDKIEVKFLPAEIEFGSVSVDSLIYQAFINGSFDKASASGQASELLLDEDGYYHMIVKNLENSTNYKVTVRVTDPTTGQSDSNVVICEVKTDDEYKPNFEGLLSVEPYPGIEGNSKALLSWNEALPGKEIFDGIYDKDYLVDKYLIYMGESPDNLSYIGEAASTALDYTVPSLSKNKEYFFKVNAIDVNGREERNQIIRSLQLTDLKDIEFEGTDKVETIHSLVGYSALNVTWKQASGPFSIYKVFKISETDPDYGSTISNPNNTTYLYRTITDVRETKITIQGLSSNIKYDVIIVACLSYDDNTCEATPAFKGHDKKVTGITSPKLTAFGGITDFIQPSGIIGLTQATLKWNPPSNEGVCDKIKVRDVYNDNQDLPICGSGVSTICLDTTTNGPKCTDTSVTVKNLETSNPPNEIHKYCFQAYVVSGTRKQSEDSITTKCGELSFEQPVFQGNFLSCEAQSATSIKVSWTAPNPAGVYQNFILFKKEFKGTDPSEGKDWFTYAKGNYESSGTLFTDWSHEVIASNVDTNTFTGLAPGTTYSFMIKTVATIGASDYRYDGNTVLKYCKTKDIELEFDDWSYIGAFGPRYDPQEFTLLPHTVTSLTGAGGEVTALNHTTGAGEGEEGNAVFAFKDFKFSNGESYMQYRNRLGITNSDDGYYLLRSETDFPTDKETAINTIDPNNPSWTVVASVSANDLEVAGTVGTQGFITLIDKVSNFHPRIDPSVAGLTTYEKAQRGKIVNYAIRAVLNGNYIRLNPEKSKNAIVMTILPPANMAMLHPWMVNKDFCTKVSSTTDPDKNYRCSYSGSGSKEDPIDEIFYFDEKAISIIDIADLGCKITKSTDPTTDPIEDQEGKVYNVTVIGNTCVVNRDGNTQSTELYDSGTGIYTNNAVVIKPTPGISNSNGDRFVASFGSAVTTKSYYYYSSSAGAGVYGPDDGKWYAQWYEIEREYLTYTSNSSQQTGSYGGFAVGDIVDYFKPYISKKHYSFNNFYLVSPVKCGDVEITQDTTSWNINKNYNDLVKTARPAGCSSSAVQLFIAKNFETDGSSNFYGSRVYLTTLSSQAFENGYEEVINELYPSLAGDFKSGEWMTKLTNIFASNESAEYFNRTYSSNTDSQTFGLGSVLEPGGDSNFGIRNSQANFLCQSKSIAIKKNGNYLPKKIRKRLITSKEAYFSQDKYIINALSSGNILNDQFICSYNFVDSKYDCSANPSSSQITNFETLNNDYPISFPFSAYNLTEISLPDQDTYINSTLVKKTFDLAGENSGTIGQYSIYKDNTALEPYSDIIFSNPKGETNQVRCAIQIEIDDGAIIQTVDDRN